MDSDSSYSIEEYLGPRQISEEQSPRSYDRSQDVDQSCDLTQQSDSDYLCLTDKCPHAEEVSRLKQKIEELEATLAEEREKWEQERQDLLVTVNVAVRNETEVREKLAELERNLESCSKVEADLVKFDSPPTEPAATPIDSLPPPPESLSQTNESLIHSASDNNLFAFELTDTISAPKYERGAMSARKRYPRESIGKWHEHRERNNMSVKDLVKSLEGVRSSE